MRIIILLILFVVDISVLKAQTTITNTVTTNALYFVGQSTSGNSLIMSNGGNLFVTNSQSVMGYTTSAIIGSNSISSSNSVLVTGIGSVWTNKGSLTVGLDGSHNSLSVSNGAFVLSEYGFFGMQSSSSNNDVLVTGNGSVWSNGALYVGYQGSANNLTISNGGKVFSQWGATVGNLYTTSSNNSFFVTGPGSLYSNYLYADIHIGGGQSNSFVISNGATAILESAGVDIQSASNSMIKITGADSCLIVNNGSIGIDGKGNSLIISDGAKVLGSPILGIYGSNNTAFITGIGSLLEGGNNVTIGAYGSLSSLVVSNKAMVLVDNGQIGLFGSNNNVIVTGVGSVWSNRGYLDVGLVGQSNALTISDGAQVFDERGFIGQGSYLYSTNTHSTYLDISSSNNSVLITGTGSVLSNRIELVVGNFTQGNRLTIDNGASAYATNMVVGWNPSSTNNLVATSGGGSQLIVTNSSLSGRYDIRRGTNVQDGGTMRADNLFVTNSQGLYQLNGGTAIVGVVYINNGQTFNVGNGLETAYFNQNRSGVVNVFANGITVNTNGIFSFAGTINNQIVLNGGTLRGTGTLTTSLTIDNGSIIAPGNSPGNANFASQTWGGGGIYQWEINNFTGTATNNWDFINVSGLLDITASAGSPFILQVKTLDSFNSPGLAQNWNMNVDQAWKILSAGSINGFATNKFNIDLTGFQNPLGTGGFFISQVGNDLYLNFNHLATVPEPKTYAMLAFGALLTCLYFRLGLKRKNRTHGA